MHELPPFTSFLQWWTTVNAWLAARGAEGLTWPEASAWWNASPWAPAKRVDEQLLNRIVSTRKPI